MSNGPGNGDNEGNGRRDNLTRDEQEFVERSINDIEDTSEMTDEDVDIVGEAFGDAEQDASEEYD